MRNFLLLAAAIATAAPPEVVIDAGITAEIAIEAALDEFRQPAPSEGECENCRGTGKIGDGRIVYDCPACGGDGIKECVECKIR